MIKQAHIYRFNDAVAVALPGASATVYLSPRDAALTGEAISRISQDIVVRRFTRSDVRALDLEVMPSETARNQTLARMADEHIRRPEADDPKAPEKYGNKAAPPFDIVRAVGVARGIIEWDNVHHDIPDQIVSEAVALVRGVLLESDVLPEREFEACVMAIENIIELEG